jgi:hypothetical protein
MAINTKTRLEHQRLKVGEESSTGQIVESILGQSSKVTVFTTKDGHLRWQYHQNGGDISDTQFSIVSEFDSLMTEIRVYVPEHNKQEAYIRLGKALFSALNGADEKQTALHFNPVRMFIIQASTQRARFIYTAFALAIAACAITVFLVIACLWFPNDILFFYGAVFGAAGAAVSVMQRSKDIALDNRLPIRSIYLQACIRVLLGAIFGRSSFSQAKRI